MPGVTLDAGALIAFERNDRRAIAVIASVRRDRETIVVPAGVLGHVWRDGRIQVALARLLVKPEVVIEPLDDLRARAAGQLCGVTGTADVIDASVVLCARTYGHPVVTSDPGDLRRLDSSIRLIVI